MSYVSAEKLLLDLGVTEPEHIDLEAIAYHLGAFVKYRPLHSCAACIVGFGDKAIISVDSNTRSEGRKRFSVGHEIGHWVRDRGKGIYICEKSAISSVSSTRNPSERFANSYASDLLLPPFLLKKRIKNKPINFHTVKALSEEFKCSLTATALKLVQLTEFPSILVAFQKNGDRWFTKNSNIPDELFLTQRLHQDTGAFDILYSNQKKEFGPSEVRADLWVSHRDSYRYEVVEHSMKIKEDTVLSLLWWEDESQIVDLME